MVAQLVKNLPAMQETWVQSLGQEDPLEKEVATHSSILAWSMGFPQARIRSRLSFPSPGDLPDPGIEPRSPKLWADSLPSEPLRKPQNIMPSHFSHVQLFVREHLGLKP